MTSRPGRSAQRRYAAHSPRACSCSCRVAGDGYARASRAAYPSSACRRSGRQWCSRIHFAVFSVGTPTASASTAAAAAEGASPTTSLPRGGPSHAARIPGHRGYDLPDLGREAHCSGPRSAQAGPAHRRGRGPVAQEQVPEPGAVNAATPALDPAALPEPKGGPRPAPPQRRPPLRSSPGQGRAAPPRLGRSIRRRQSWTPRRAPRRRPT